MGIVAFQEERRWHVHTQGSLPFTLAEVDGSHVIINTPLLLRQPIAVPKKEFATSCHTFSGIEALRGIVSKLNLAARENEELICICGLARINSHTRRLCGGVASQAPGNATLGARDDPASWIWQGLRLSKEAKKHAKGTSQHHIY